jgi:leucyl-tRNA---protein transferase
MYFPDTFKKTVKVPVRIVGGQVHFFYGSELPRTRDTIGDLVIPYHSLIDKNDAAELAAEQTSVLLPAGSTLLINLKVDGRPEGIIKRENLTDDLPFSPADAFVRLELREALVLLHRGTKSSVLNPCNCYLPDIKEEAMSVNHAYTIASKKFETQRRSNTGNVFRHVYHCRNGRWEELGWLRERLDAQFEAKYLSDGLSRIKPPPRQPSLFEQLVPASPAAEAADPYRARETEITPTRRDPYVPPDIGLIYSTDPESGISPEEFDRRLVDGWFHYNWAYRRFSRSGNYSAVPLRIRLRDFKLSKSQRRVMRINADVEVEVAALDGMNDDEANLFRRHETRFGKNGPGTVILPGGRGEFNKKVRVRDGERLIAVSYMETGATSGHGYYAIYDPEIAWRSLGILTLLKEIEYAKSVGKEYYYLGYAYKEPTLFDYKKRFHALEHYNWVDGWHDFERLADG